MDRTHKKNGPLDVAASRAGGVDFGRPLYAQHLDDASRHWPARVVADDEGLAPEGCTFVAFGEGDDRNVIAFRSTGFPHSAARWMLQNWAPADLSPEAASQAPRPEVDWDRPLEVVFDDGHVLPAALCRGMVVDVSDRDGRVVQWGEGLKTAFDASGAQVPIAVRNAAPFDPGQPFRTRDGRPAKLVAVLSPPIADKAVVARVCLEGYQGEVLNVYRADGRAAHGHADARRAPGADDLVNDPPLTPAAPEAAWDPKLPTRTRDGRAVRVGRAYPDGGREVEVYSAERAGYVPQARRADGRVMRPDLAESDPGDLVNFDPEAELMAQQAADPLLTMDGSRVVSLETAAIDALDDGDRYAAVIGYAGDVATGSSGRMRVQWRGGGTYAHSYGRHHALDLRREPTETDRAALAPRAGRPAGGEA